MTEAVAEGNTTSAADQWREAHRRTTTQRGINQAVCKERGFSEYSFYAWPKRLRKPQPVRFALVDRGLRPEATMDACVEL